MSPSPLLPFELQLIAGSSLCLLLAWVFYLIRKGELGLRESLLWVLSTSAALTLVLVPKLLALLSSAAGVLVPANALFAASFLYVLVNLLSITIMTSRNASRVRRLAQECALLRAELDELRASSPPAGSPHG